jgi:hypothetical protein
VACRRRWGLAGAASPARCGALPETPLLALPRSAPVPPPPLLAPNAPQRWLGPGAPERLLASSPLPPFLPPPCRVLHAEWRGWTGLVARRTCPCFECFLCLLLSLPPAFFASCAARPSLLLCGCHIMSSQWAGYLFVTVTAVAVCSVTQEATALEALQPHCTAVCGHVSLYTLIVALHPQCTAVC